MSKNKPIVPGASRNVQVSNLLIVPSTAALLDNALSIINLELHKLGRASEQPGGLDERKSKLLNGYINSIINVQKEIREQSKSGADDLGELSASDMLQHVRKVAIAEKDTAALKAIDEAISTLSNKSEES